MKGLRKVIAPFAPDSSGAVSVLFDLEGIVVICDAGGCTGNVCAFDEPRWFTKKSAIFSAGLRDMDAILGRDDKLVAKLKDTADKLNARFAAVVGTPVPAVIATDYQALCRMSEKASGLPTIAVDTTGTKLYDEGAAKAFLHLFEKFSDPSCMTEKGTVGVLGVTPLDFYGVRQKERFHRSLLQMGYTKVVVYGYEHGLEDYWHAKKAEKNIVVSPSGLLAAQYLQKTFGTPYEVTCPIAAEEIADWLDGNQAQIRGKKILIVHQQVYANELRRAVLAWEPESVTVASWFQMDKEFFMEGDLHLTEEDEWQELVATGGYDIIIADEKLRKAVRHYEGQWVHTPHYAVSGQMGFEQPYDA